MAQSQSIMPRIGARSNTPPDALLVETADKDFDVQHALDGSFSLVIPGFLNLRVVGCKSLSLSKPGE